MGDSLKSLARLGSAGIKGVRHQVLLASFTIKCSKTKNNSASLSRKEVAQQLCFLTQWNTTQKRKGKDSLSSFVQTSASELSQEQKVHSNKLGAVPENTTFSLL